MKNNKTRPPLNSNLTGKRGGKWNGGDKIKTGGKLTFTAHCFLHATCSQGWWWWSIAFSIEGGRVAGMAD